MNFPTLKPNDNWQLVPVKVKELNLNLTWYISDIMAKPVCKCGSRGEQHPVTYLVDNDDHTRVRDLTVVWPPLMAPAGVESIIRPDGGVCACFFCEPSAIIRASAAMTIATKLKMPMAMADAVAQAMLSGEEQTIVEHDGPITQSMNIRVLTADTPEDIDNWPPAEQVFPKPSPLNSRIKPSTMPGRNPDKDLPIQ